MTPQNRIFVLVLSSVGFTKSLGFRRTEQRCWMLHFSFPLCYRPLHSYLSSYVISPVDGGYVQEERMISQENKGSRRLKVRKSRRR